MLDRIKWMVLDNLPTIWIIAIITFSVILAADHAGVL